MEHGCVRQKLHKRIVVRLEINFIDESRVPNPFGCSPPRDLVNNARPGWNYEKSNDTAGDVNRIQTKESSRYVLAIPLLAFHKQMGNHKSTDYYEHLHRMPAVQYKAKSQGQ
jgi:hypothetical protein